MKKLLALCLLICIIGCKNKPFTAKIDANETLIIDESNEKNYILYGVGSNMEFSLGINIFGNFAEPMKIMGDLKYVSAQNDKIAIIKNDNSFWINKNDDSIRLIEKYKWQKIAKNVKSIKIGKNHILYLDNQNQLWGFGSNINGQLGLGKETKFINKPTLIASDIIDYSCGDEHSFYIQSDNILKGFGSNKYGQIGLQNGYENVYVPTTIEDQIDKVFTGINSIFYINNESKLFACGENDSYQLGD